MHSPRRKGRVALAILVPLFGAGITYACSDTTSSPARLNVDSSVPARALSAQPPGLVAAYGFEESSGATAIDVSGNNNNGTLGTGVTRAAAGRFGAGVTFQNGMVTI